MKGTFTFAVFSDNHLYTPSDPIFGRMLADLKQAGEAGEMEAVMSLGDNFAMIGRERCASNEEIGTLLREMTEAVSDAAGVPVFAINGNHDGIGTDFFDPALWIAAVGSRFTGGLDVREENRVYYYVDYPDKELRLVFLSLPCGSDFTGEYPVPRWEFGEEQLKWFAEDALAVPDGVDVMLFCHVPPFYEYAQGENEPLFTVFDGEKQTKAKLSSLMGYINDRDCFLRIVNAFGEKKAFADPALGVQGDYTQVGKLLCMISGHTHRDKVIAPGADCFDPECPNRINELPCPQIIVNRTITGGAAGYAFDVVTLAEGCLTFTRHGDGENRRVVV